MSVAIHTLRRALKTLEREGYVVDSTIVRNDGRCWHVKRGAFDRVMTRSELLSFAGIEA